MTTGFDRRRFIRILPAAGAGLLAACSDKPAEAPAAPPAPAPAPAPAAAPAPVAETAAAPAPAPAPPAATGAALPLIAEDHPTAVALAYVADNARVDRSRHAGFQPDQKCASCALYQGAAGSQAGGCPLFAGHWVAATGWCTAWARKG